jgi:hypothetical protein
MGGGSSAPTPQPVQTSGGSPNYIPQFSGQNDVNLQGIQGLEYGSAATLPQYLIPQYQSVTNDIVNNPFAGGAQQAGINAGAQAGGLAVNENNNATDLTKMAYQAQPYAQQLLQTGFDPQQALYDRTQQQVQDQLRAQNASSGLSSSPYGAGVVDQGLSNFNIDWQNQQLQRQATAAQGYGALSNAIGQDYTGANALQTQAIGNLQNAGGIPFSTAQGISQSQLGGLGALAAGVQTSFGPAQTLAQDYQSYLGLGNQASGSVNAAQNSQFANQLAAFNAQQNQQNQSLAGLGSLGSGLFGASGIFGQGSAGGGAFGSGGLFDLSNIFNMG